MTISTNAFSAFDAKGNREDLADFIANISPMECPAQDFLPRSTATAVKHEWQTDTITAPSDNIQLEGDAVSATARTATSRLYNNCQISYDVFSVTGTQEVVTKAGRKSELKYQALKSSKFLKRVFEHELLDNNALAAGNSSTARQSAGFENWIGNADRGTGGSVSAIDGTGTVTDGTQRTFTETLVKNALVTTYTAGGKPNVFMVGPTHKQQFSTFAGNATRFVNAQDEELNAAIFVYRSDFGDHQVVTNRWMRGHGGAGIRSCLGVQTDMAAIAWLRPPFMKIVPIAADAESRMILGEYTLEMRNQYAHFIVADLT